MQEKSRHAAASVHAVQAVRPAIVSVPAFGSVQDGAFLDARAGMHVTMSSGGAVRCVQYVASLDALAIVLVAKGARIASRQIKEVAILDACVVV